MSNNSNKNIILCADGTGNKGGYTPDSNVYKTYNGVDIHLSEQKQISFYDNGVGTSTNKIFRALSGGLGIGFQRNVRDLYRFLAMNYVDGDQVYLFGFSRGAATVRAFLGFIATCGLVKGKDLTYEKLEEYTQHAFDAYKKRLKDPEVARRFREHPNSHGIIPIHFIGVWDTVSALGLPERTDKLGILSRILSVVFETADKILNIFWPHHFYKYDLSDNVSNACQALALDDARTSFWPMVWDEKKYPAINIEQVWFAGMHSNVGGGYERQGMANVTLYWMLLRAKDKGLKLKPDFLEKQQEDAHVNGRLYDSRDGLAIFYRFHPREIEKLCHNKLNDDIKIHATVFDRMALRTANYAPTHLPRTFQTAYSELDLTGESYTFTENTDWQYAATKVNKYVNIRKLNYMTMLLLTIILLTLAICTWTGHIDFWGRSGLAGHLADIADYLTPTMFEGLVELSIMRYPVYSLALLAGGLAFWKFNNVMRKKTVEAAIRIRNIINASVKIK